VDLASLRARIAAGDRLTRAEVTHLWAHADDDALADLAMAARGRFHPADRASYLVMAIVNYTNVCVARCDYCAFYRLPKQEGAYLLSTDAVCAKIDALVSHGGDLVGFNGGFHPKLRIDHYAELFQAVRGRYPQLEFYEMTVAEFMYSCKVTQISYAAGAARLRASGTRWVTGGGAEVLDDAFRLRHSPLKYTVEDYYDAQRAILDAGMGSTATMVIGFDETFDERMNHLDRLRRFQDESGGRLPSFLCWTYKPFHTALGGTEISEREYLRWLALCRIYLDNFRTIRTSVLTRNEGALRGLRFGADDFDLPTEDEVTQKAGATVSLDFEPLLAACRAEGFTPVHRRPFPVPTSPVIAS